MKVSEFIQWITGTGRLSDDIEFRVKGFVRRYQELDGSYHGSYEDSFEIDSEITAYDFNRKNRKIVVTFEVDERC